MRVQPTVVFAMFAVMCLAIASCAPKPTAANSADAINKSANLPSVDAKVNYLIKEAKAFIGNKQYDEAVNTAQYVLTNVKQDSDEARRVLEKAAGELRAMAEKHLADAKNEMNKMIGK